MLPLLSSRVLSAPVFTMLSFVLSRSFCQLVAGVNRSSSPAVGAVIRTFTSSSPARGEATDDASVVTYTQLKSMLSSQDLQLFDVRNPDEYQAGSIADSVNIPLGILEESLRLSPDVFHQRFRVKAPGKEDDNLVFYCRSGNRSNTALNIARELGFNRVRHYKGGFIEWTEKDGK